MSDGASAPTVVTPEQFGAAGNCIADDTSALLAMRNSLISTQATNTSPLTINLRAGACYMYTSNRWTWGIRNLKVLGNGASLQNMASFATSGSAAAYPLIINRSLFETEAIDAPLHIPTINIFIQAAAVGATSVTLKDATNAASFVPGKWAVVYSYNQQIEGGYPPNARYFDYAKIASVNGAVITLDRPLAHAHSDTFPEASAQPPILAGAARIYPIDGFSPVPFSESIYIENVTMLDNPNARRSTDGPGPNDPLFKSHQFLLVQGTAQATLKNVTVSEFVPSQSPLVIVSGSHFFASEVDKLLTEVDFTDTTIDNGLNECSGVDTLRYTGGSMQMAICAPRQAFYSGVTFNAPNVSVNYPPTINLNISFPTDLLSIANSIFNGGGGTSIPIGASLNLDLPVDGTTVVPGSSQISMPDLTVAANRNFTHCIKPGGQISLIKSGQTLEQIGTISGIIDAGNGGGVIAMSMSPQVGDTVRCHPIAHGGVVLSSNSFTNYGGAAVLP